MPPGNAVRIRGNADQIRTAPAGSHEWLPYSNMSCAESEKGELP